MARRVATAGARGQRVVVNAARAQGATLFQAEHMQPCANTLQYVGVPLEHIRILVRVHFAGWPANLHPKCLSKPPQPEDKSVVARTRDTGPVRDGVEFAKLYPLMKWGQLWVGSPREEHCCAYPMCIAGLTVEFKGDVIVIDVPRPPVLKEVACLSHTTEDNIHEAVIVVVKHAPAIVSPMTICAKIPHLFGGKVGGVGR
eukprot:CAMPEP_0181210092 /NCGR_PEP_ID=MMETSP1096-20121128/23037_1 /TAXON_ID=156174 ORGANISM="Chrysochromulina ericina, Strain CCMP281" /NCGR_SAMPLE_ID=MMETSP1096 /ASSEMBLY_ACC=CAM_ASM_000453 /LENGTH=199 /DNA_ID=CAMNT_0023301341 /DNA_START=195 /DNA_END=791 /DNA_ORIENTATION=-